METDVLEILQNFHSDGLFVAPNIPSKKAKNASACYGMPASVNIYAIVDSTVFGSAKNGLAFTSEGLFWKNDWTTTSAKNHMSWEELINTSQEHAVDGSELLLGQDCAFGMAGSGMKPAVLLKLLEKLAQKIQGNTEATETAEVSNVAQAKVTPVADANGEVSVGNTASASVTAENLPPEGVTIESVTPAADTNGDVSITNTAPAGGKAESAAPASLTPEKPLQESSPKPAFEGSYQRDYLDIVNAVAKRHRLSQQIQIAPAIKVHKVRKVIEISEGKIEPYDILMIVDNTFMQTTKDFLVVTPHAIWAKGTLRKVESFSLSEIRSIRCDKKTLFINDYDFQYLDQFSENEVLILTNMLEELVVALRKSDSVSDTDEQLELPAALDTLLSNIYEVVLDDVVSGLRDKGYPENKQLVTSMAECCFSTFFIVDSHLKYRHQDTAELVGQYLLAQTLSGLFALMSVERLWRRTEVKSTYVMMQCSVIIRTCQYFERQGIALRPNQNWYLQLFQTVMDANTLEQGAELIDREMGNLSADRQLAIDCAFKSGKGVREMLCDAL
ncbi:hypothetical protein L2728_08920 [Shewanella chilikensis]|jgi:hypothetical protein|uniref:hypothetical protein n=1 Tax=Shewanella chilikensis TaxID=558541 RepID=UPI00200DC525|nr:hypothetical protein [Shewanella chilikensis]MCL1162001.1 hypothetical protein [Shewanella chilikensis]